MIRAILSGLAEIVALTLFVAAQVIIGDFVGVISSLLAGEQTVRSLLKAAVVFAIATSLLRPVAPRTMATSRRATPNSSARNATSAALASPSTGGDVSATLSAPSCSPSTALRDARGWTRTGTIAAPSRSVISTVMRGPFRLRPS